MKDGYKANRQTPIYNALSFEERQQIYIYKIEANRKVMNDKRAAKGLPPREYKPIIKEDT